MLFLSYFLYKLKKAKFYTPDSKPCFIKAHQLCDGLEQKNNSRMNGVTWKYALAITLLIYIDIPINKTKT